MTNYEPTPVRRGQLPPAEMVNDLQAAAAQASTGGGFGMVQFPGGNVFLPPDIEEIWIIITGQGSGSGRGGVMSGTPISQDNYYAWRQVQIVIDDYGNETAEEDPSGLFGNENSNPAIELNGSIDVPEGVVVRAYLSPSRNAWHFIWNGEESSGSGSGAGNRYRITCNSDGSVTVTRA